MLELETTEEWELILRNLPTTLRFFESPGVL